MKIGETESDIPLKGSSISNRWGGYLQPLLDRLITLSIGQSFFVGELPRAVTDQYIRKYCRSKGFQVAVSQVVKGSCRIWLKGREEADLQTRLGKAFAADRC